MRRTANKNNNKKKFKLQIASKNSLFRLAILFVILIILSFWAWLAMFWMPEQSYRGQLPPLTNEEITLQNSLRQDLQKIAIDLGARNENYYEQLNAAKIFFETSFAQAGYQVKLQEYKIKGKSYYNIEAEKLGTTKPQEIVVVGGHYDSAFNSPGVNDNGTGAAATLELARIFAKKSPQRTIRFVEFTNEEPPFFWTENMGSLVYARRSHQAKENIVAMLSLETMGYFSDEANSQKYPSPLNLIYPDRGNFISFIGNLGSGSLVRTSIASFRRHARFPSEGASVPSWLSGIGWSDHWSFWQQGYRGIMVTDTATYRYPYYHTGEDTIDKIDFDRLTRVVAGLAEVVSDLGK